MEIAASQLRVGEAVRSHLEDIQIRRGCEDFFLQQDAVAHALNKSQYENSSSASAAHTWLSLISAFPKQFPAQLKLVVQRSTSCLENPLFLAAYVVHPEYNGKGLTARQIALAREFLEKETGSPADVALFLAKQPPFSPQLFENKIDPSAWWRSGSRNEFPQRLSSVAVDLLSCMSSSAALERQFHTMRLTYGMLRSRLDVERSGKLAFLFRVFNS